MVVARRGIVSLDCDDPDTLAEFWAAMLGGEVMFRHDTSIVVRTEWLWMSAMRIPDYRAPTWPSNDVPKQIHLNLAVDNVESAVAEALRLGARIATFQPSPSEFRVMLDPAGHPFCLTTLPSEVSE
ncbi:MAG TPA: VOC family protein [Acidimicrobiales bacterium]